MVAKSETEWMNYQIALDLGYSWLKNQSTGEVCFVSLKLKNENSKSLNEWDYAEDPAELKDIPEYDKNTQMLYDDYCVLLVTLRDTEIQ